MKPRYEQISIFDALAKRQKRTTPVVLRTEQQILSVFGYMEILSRLTICDRLRKKYGRYSHGAIQSALTNLVEDGRLCVKRANRNLYRLNSGGNAA